MLALAVGGFLEEGLEILLLGLLLAFLLGGLVLLLGLLLVLVLGLLLLVLRLVLVLLLLLLALLALLLVGVLGEVVADEQEGFHDLPLGVVGDGRGEEGDDGVGGASDEVTVGGGEGGLVGGGGGLLELLLGPLGEEEAELLGEGEHLGEVIAGGLVTGEALKGVGVDGDGDRYDLVFNYGTSAEMRYHFYVEDGEDGI